MDEFLKSYEVLGVDRSEDNLGCIIMNRDLVFNKQLFQERLNKAMDELDIESRSHEAVFKVLSEHPEDYKNIIFIKNSGTFYA